MYRLNAGVSTTLARQGVVQHDQHDEQGLKCMLTADLQGLNDLQTVCSAVAAEQGRAPADPESGP